MEFNGPGNFGQRLVSLLRGNKFAKWILMLGISGVIIAAVAIGLKTEPSKQKAFSGSPESHQHGAQMSLEKKYDAGHYMCPMHPSVRQEGAGKCPICKMDLIFVPPADQAVVDKNSDIISNISLGERARKLAQVNSTVVETRLLTKEIQASGRVEVSKEKQARVSASFPDGRIEKLFVNYEGAAVKKGAPLMEIYSPLLITTQREYILAREGLHDVKDSPFPETLRSARSLVKMTEKRLKQWGVTTAQIKKLARTGKTQERVVYHSPITGIAMKVNAVEGNYYKEGDVCFELVDLSVIWVHLDIFENELAWIKSGLDVKVNVPAYPHMEFSGKIIFIEPFLNPQTRSIKVRVELPNPEQKLLPGMLAEALIFVKSPKEVLAVPEASVITTGKRAVVYLVEGEGKYTGREVKLGMKAEGWYEVVKGLNEFDEVVTHASFLIDSQSRLNGSNMSEQYQNATQVETDAGK